MGFRRSYECNNMVGDRAFKYDKNRYFSQTMLHLHMYLQTIAEIIFLTVTNHDLNPLCKVLPFPVPFLSYEVYEVLPFPLPFPSYEVLPRTYERSYTSRTISKHLTTP